MIAAPLPKIQPEPDTPERIEGDRFIVIYHYPDDASSCLTLDGEEKAIELAKSHCAAERGNGADVYEFKRHIFEG